MFSYVMMLEQKGCGSYHDACVGKLDFLTSGNLSVPMELAADVFEES